MEKGILIVAFGSTHIEALEKTIFKLKEELENKYKNLPVYLAFTSDIIIERLEKKEVYIENIEEALFKMQNAGIKKIYLQPYLLIEGIEYKKILEKVDKFNYEESNTKIITGKPLLHKRENYLKIIKLLQKENYGGVTLYIGHGTREEENNFYLEFKKAINSLNYKNTYIQTLNDIDNIDKLLLTFTNRDKIRIVPVFLLAGNHVRKDLIYNKNSWKNILKNKGYHVEVELIGLGEYKEIRDLFLESLMELI